MQRASQTLVLSENLVRLRALLLVILIVLFGSASFLRVFHSRGEPREAIVVQDMLREGNYILAHGYSNFVPSKPPLFHWISALFSTPNGQVTEITARLPSVLSAVIACILVFNFFAKNSSSLLAFNTTLLLSTSFEWLRAASAARVDMVLSFALIASFIAIYNWDQRKYQGYPFLLLLSLIAAVLTKGPVGAVLPGFIFSVYSLLNKEKFSDLVLRGLKVFIPAMLIASLWYLAAYLERPEAFLNKIYFENVERFLGSEKKEPHEASAFTLYLTVVAGFMPWSIALLAIAYQRRSQVLPYIRTLKNHFISWDKLTTFSIVVTLCTLFFYSIPASKRGVYVLPLYPFLSLLFARILLQQSSEKWLGILSKGMRYVFGIVLMIPIFGIVLARFSFSPVVDEVLKSFSEYYYQHALLAFLLIAMYLLVIFLKFSEVKIYNLSAFQRFFVLLFSVNVIVQIFLVPALMNPISGAKFAEQAKDLIQGSKRVLSFGEEFYAISFYSNRTFFRAEEVPPEAGDLVIIDKDDLDSFKQLGKNYEQLMESSGSVISYGNKLVVFRILQ